MVPDYPVFRGPEKEMNTLLSGIKEMLVAIVELLQKEISDDE